MLISSQKLSHCRNARPFLATHALEMDVMVLPVPVTKIFVSLFIIPCKQIAQLCMFQSFQENILTFTHTRLVLVVPVLIHYRPCRTRFASPGMQQPRSLPRLGRLISS